MGNNDSDTQYMGFWIRFIGYLIDSLILGSISVIISFIIFKHLPTKDDRNIFFNLASFLIAFSYAIFLESSRYQGTIGKMVIGAKVTDLAGKRISLGRAIGRYFGKIISALVLCIGFIMVALTEKKQGLHDFIAKTLVVKR